MAGEALRVETTIDGHYAAQHGDDILYLTAEEKEAIQKLETYSRKKRRRSLEKVVDILSAASNLSISSTTIPSDKADYNVLKATNDEDKGGPSCNYVAYLNKNGMEEGNEKAQNTNMMAIVYDNR